MCTSIDAGLFREIASLGAVPLVSQRDGDVISLLSPSSSDDRERPPQKTIRDNDDDDDNNDEKDFNRFETII